MAANTLATEFTTISISTSGDTVTTRGRSVWCKNLGANTVNVSLSANPAGGVPAAGNVTTLNKLPATGAADGILLAPNTQYFLRADTGATLVAFEEVSTPTEFTQRD